MSPARSAWLAVGLALAVSAAEAQAPAGPAVGTSATYRWTSTLTQPVSVLVQQPGPGGQVTGSVAEERTAPPPIFVTYSIVRADRRSYTMQIVTHQTPDGPPLSITQVTVTRASGKAVRSVIQRPKGVIPTPESGLRPLREAGVRDGKREDVTVPAGTFTAVRGKVQDAEVWVADQAPALGLVKAVWPSGALELVRSTASGAKDLLAGAK